MLLKIFSEKTKGKPRQWVSEWQKDRHKKIRDGDIINPNSKRWQITDPEGNVFVIDNLPPFCKEHGLSQGNLSGGKTKGYSAICLGYARDF